MYKFTMVSLARSQYKIYVFLNGSPQNDNTDFRFVSHVGAELVICPQALKGVELSSTELAELSKELSHLELSASAISPG